MKRKAKRHFKNWSKGRQTKVKEKEIQKALKYLNRMDAGLTYRPDDLTALEVQYIDIVQSAKNEFQMEEQQKNRR